MTNITRAIEPELFLRFSQQGTDAYLDAVAGAAERARLRSGGP